MFDEIISEWDRRMDAFYKLHQENDSFWLPSSYAWGKMIPAVVATAICCAVVFWISSSVLVNNVFSNDTPTSKKTKACYQLTNLCFNVALGSLGVYYEYWILPTLPSFHATNRIEKIPHHENEFYLFSAMQFGYQIWALPVGLYYVKESKEMIFHHVAVVLSSTLSGFAYCGFRYWTPYFYGIMEISSVPLAIMNAFRDNPEWIKKHQFLYLLTRAAFSFSFLYIRVYMWLQVGPQFLLDDFFLFLTTKFGIEKIFLLLQFILGMFLGYLQLYWGFLVLKGIVSFFVPQMEEDGKASNEKKQE